MYHMKPEVVKPDGKRSGRGFSRGELKKAGLNKAEAKKLKIPVDLRRKTAYDQNVETLRACARKKQTEAKPKREMKAKSKKKAKK